VNVEAIASVAPLAGTQPAATPEALTSAAAEPAAGKGFGAILTQGLEGLNHDLVATQGDLQALAVGDSANLHQVMIRLEETRLSFQLAVQVRNRLLEAYQDVMRMQV